jgi:hypothetical protein
VAIKIRSTDEDGSLNERTITRQGTLTQKKIDEADKLDEKIKKLIGRIEKDAEEKGLMKLSGKKGKVVELYHFVGTELKPFIDSLKLPKTEMEDIWNPLNFHAKELAVDETRYRQSKTKGYGSTLYICYRLASFTKKDTLEYDWTEWVEIFDSTITRNDTRVVTWLIEAKKKHFEDGSLQLWFRTLMRVIRNEFTVSRKIETTWLTKKELYSQLDACRKKSIPILKEKIEEEKKKIDAKKKTASKKSSPKKKTSAAKKKTPR